jgi:hypothetical protein
MIHGDPKQKQPRVGGVIVGEESRARNSAVVATLNSLFSSW